MVDIPIFWDLTFRSYMSLRTRIDPWILWKYAIWITIPLISWLNRLVMPWLMLIAFYSPLVQLHLSQSQLGSRYGSVYWKGSFLSNRPHVFGVWISNCIINILSYIFFFGPHNGTGSATLFLSFCSFNLWGTKHKLIINANVSTVLAECGSLTPLFHWTCSYGHLIHYGAHTDNWKYKFCSQGWSTLHSVLKKNENNFYIVNVCHFSFHLKENISLQWLDNINHDELELILPFKFLPLLTWFLSKIEKKKKSTKFLSTLWKSTKITYGLKFIWCSNNFSS